MSAKAKPTPRVAYHYTIGARLPAIIRDGAIRPATAGVRGGETPLVWCTTSPRWEETANKAIATPRGVVPLDREGTAAQGGGLARIVVRIDAAPWTARDWRRRGRIGAREYAALVSVARQVGSNPERDWRMSARPITRDKWIGVEVWRGDRWVSLHNAVVDVAHGGAR